MTEVLWHGRGGQGAFTAARLLGAASSLDDAAFALAFPSFGPERRGAPIRAFTKISATPIGDRSAIERADYVIYLDETLLSAGWEDELASGGRVLLNAPFVPACAAGDARVIAIDANKISTEILGRPIPNTVFLGVLAALDVLPLDNVKRAIELYMPKKLHASNEEIVERAFSEVAQAYAAAACSGDAIAAGSAGSGVGAPADAAVGIGAGSGVGASASSSAGIAAGTPVGASDDVFNLRTSRGACIIPALRHDQPKPEEFARSTCFSAGHLIEKNAGWRNERPIVDASKCVGCLQCYLYCPDGTVFKVPSGEGKMRVAIDYDFCKGCGMCVRACKFDAIHMEAEVQDR